MELLIFVFLFRQPNHLIHWIASQGEKETKTKSFIFLLSIFLSGIKSIGACFQMGFLSFLLHSGREG